MSDDISLQALPPKEAVDYFEAKGYKISFDWRDMWQQEHASAFTVAKVMRNDLLQDIRQAVGTAISDGQTFDTFKKNLKPVLVEKGWWGKGQMVDPKTGILKDVQLGSTRRLQTIFDVNMRTSYAAGHWERIQRTKKTRPYLRYVGIGDDRERPEHRQWNDIVRPVDDPFWDTHYPPNGWRCRCSVQQLSERDVQRLGLNVADTPPDTPEKTWIDRRNGQVVKVPQGIDPGFGYNVGHARMKSLAPPALDRPLAVPFTGDPLTVPPPVPRPFPKDLILPDDLPDQEYVDKFLAEFGATTETPTVFKDKLGEPLVISDDFLKSANGKLKIRKRDRHLYLRVLAQAIKDPDEIFWLWEEYPKGRMTLTRRYLTTWQDGDDQTESGFAIFDINKEGWTGITTFKPDSVAYTAKQRVGVLAYRRPDEKPQE